jgi:hypothetical protein
MDSFRTVRDAVLIDMDLLYAPISRIRNKQMEKLSLFIRAHHIFIILILIQEISLLE